MIGAGVIEKLRASPGSTCGNLALIDEMRGGGNGAVIETGLPAKAVDQQVLLQLPRGCGLRLQQLDEGQ